LPRFPGEIDSDQAVFRAPNSTVGIGKKTPVGAAIRGVERPQMKRAKAMEMANAEEIRAKARELTVRHGEHAEEYVKTRVEASQIAGESEDAEAWQQVLNLLEQGVEAEPVPRSQMPSERAT
jgi:hypothetical protein